MYNQLTDSKVSEMKKLLKLIKVFILFCKIYVLIVQSDL